MSSCRSTIVCMVSPPLDLMTDDVARPYPAAWLRPTIPTNAFCTWGVRNTRQAGQDKSEKMPGPARPRPRASTTWRGPRAAIPADDRRAILLAGRGVSRAIRWLRRDGRRRWLKARVTAAGVVATYGSPCASRSSTPRSRLSGSSSQDRAIARPGSSCDTTAPGSTCATRKPVRRLPATARQDEFEGNRHRPGDGPAHRPPSRRRGPGGRRGREGGHLLVHARRPRGWAAACAGSTRRVWFRARRPPDVQRQRLIVGLGDRQVAGGGSSRGDRQVCDGASAEGRRLVERDETLARLWGAGCAAPPRFRHRVGGGRRTGVEGS